LDAYVAYVSSGQVNILLPGSVPAGLTNVELTTPSGGVTSSVMVASVAPSLFAYRLKTINYAAATFAGVNGVLYAAAVGAFSNSRPAQAGDVVQLFGTGIGLTKSAPPDGQLFSTVYPALDLTAFHATIGGKQAAVQFAGMVSPGLFQVNIQIPSNVPSGDQPLVVTVSQVATQPNLMLTMG